MQPDASVVTASCHAMVEAVLGAAPPVLIAGEGRMASHDAIAWHLLAVHSLSSAHPVPFDELATQRSQICDISCLKGVCVPAGGKLARFVCSRAIG